MSRSVLLLAHTARDELAELAAKVGDQLTAAGFDVRMLEDEAADCQACGVSVTDSAQGVELVLVLGGDGTFLRAVELARPARVPLLGVNLGHVGFLAAAEPQSLDRAVQAIIRGDYEVDERVTVEAEISYQGRMCATAWALNEVSLERTNRERMLEVSVSVDGRPLQRFGCDGVLCSTPTGSTAYAFSAGGPVVWPNVDAMIVVPNAAHALFSRPLVVAPSSTVDIDLVSVEHAAVLSCDGRRSVAVPSGARVRVRRGDLPVQIVRLGEWTFTDRLVTKFGLPVRSFREAGKQARVQPGLEPGSDFEADIDLDSGYDDGSQG